MPVDPVSDLPVGPYIARSLDSKSMLAFGAFPAENHLRYIGRPHYAVNAEDIWELLAETPPVPFSHKMGHWG